MPKASVLPTTNQEAAGSSPLARAWMYVMWVVMIPASLHEVPAVLQEIEVLRQSRVTSRQ
jgi:hypothetical protein